MKKSRMFSFNSLMELKKFMAIRNEMSWIEWAFNADPEEIMVYETFSGCWYCVTIEYCDEDTYVVTDVCPSGDVVVVNRAYRACEPGAMFVYEDYEV